jgi:DNA-directed RNA polymerase subunit RPC12/RpoP
MADFKFSCSHCNQHIQCDEKLSGRQIKCPHCNVVIQIAAVPGNTGQFNPQSGMTWLTHVPSGTVEPPQGLSIRRKEDDLKQE